MADKFLRSFLLLTISVTPIIPTYFDFGYEEIKVLVFVGLTVISGLIFTYLLTIKKLHIHWTEIKIAGLIFLVILSFTSILGIHPFDSLTGKYPYFQGLIVYWFLYLFFLMVSEVNIKVSVIAKTLILSSFIVAIVAITEFILLNVLKIQIPNYAGRVVSTFGQPNLYSGYLLLSLPLIFYEKQRNYLIIGIILIAILISFSKAAIGLLGGSTLIFLLLKLKRWETYLFAFILIIISIFLIEQSGVIGEEVIKPLTAGKIDTGTAEKRAYILPVMLELYSKSPIGGAGLDSVSTLYIQKFAGFSPEIIAYTPVDFNLKNLLINRSHNYFMDLLIFSGVLGLLSYFYLIYLLFRTRTLGFLNVFLVIYLVWVQIQVQSIAHLILFWFIAGVIDNRNHLKDDKF